MSETPWGRYQDDIKNRGFTEDPAQLEAVKRLDQLYQALEVEQDRPGLLSRLLGRTLEAPKGLYLWGGVGRGKTYLMDTFYECLTIASRRRVHFHRFMEDVHERLGVHAGTANPLIPVADELISQARVLCFDEFFVVDIADAMILGGLLDAMFERGLVLVATSNIEPDGLYRDGLQRAKFLPAIELLKRHTEVLNVDGETDYRLRILSQAKIYHWPLGDEADASLEQALSDLAPGQIHRATTLRINRREVDVVACTEGIVWCTFAELCEDPRSSADYIELSRRFNTVILSGVPALTDGMNDPARRFINLIDELYDRNVNLIVSAAVEPAGIYQGKRLAFEFRRTLSRLTEMQSHEYLAREHKP
ncbi:MAG: cell division protein ZapE [Pseudomonadota bacterium]